MHSGNSLPDGLALVFDMDGVIIDSTPVHNLAWQSYLRRFGIERTIAEIEAAMHGKRNDEIVRDFFGDGLSEDEVYRHGADKEALYRELVGADLRRHLVPGVVEFVERYSGERIGVATNAEPANVEFVLGGSGLRRHFRAVVDGHQVAKPKPAPEVYLRAAEELMVAPANCIIFEDSATGISAARGAGARVVGVRTTSEALDRCDLTIADFKDPKLLEWLGHLAPVG